MAGSAGGGSGGASGGGAGAGGSTGAGGPGPSSQGSAQKAGPVEVLDAQGNSLGEFGRDGKPMAPDVRTTAAPPTEATRGRDPARDLVEKMAKTLGDQSQRQPEAETARGPEARVELQDAASRGAKPVEAASGKREPANEPVAPRSDAANDAKRGASMSIDGDSAERVAAARVRDTRQAAEEMGLNRVEPSIERNAQKLDADAEDKRKAWLNKTQPAPQASEAPGATPRAGSRNNQVESDEPMVARTDVKLPVPKEVEDKYLRVGDKFYDARNKERLAFEDKGSRLETRSNSEHDAQAMVAIAKARGWDEIKVSGSETFRKEAWLAAAADGMQVRGYTPTEMDKAELAKRTKDVAANKVEPAATPIRARETEADSSPQTKGKEAGSAREAVDSSQRVQQTQRESERHSRADAFAHKPAGEAVKEHPELAPAYAAVAAAQSKVDAERLPAEQKAVVMARVRQNVQNSIERGDIPEVQIREEREVSRDLARARSEDREVTR